MARSIVVAVFMAAACGNPGALRVGSIIVAPDGDRAFVAVERWTHVEVPFRDADGEPIVDDGLREAWIVELELAGGAQRIRMHDDGWLSPIGYAAAVDVMWFAREPRPGAPPIAGAARTGGEVAPPPGFEHGGALPIAGRVAVSPRLDVAPARLWDLSTGAVAELAGGWPFAPALPVIAPDRMRLAGCAVRGREVVRGVLELRGAFAAGVAAVDLVAIPLAAEPTVVGCAVTGDGTRVAMWSERAVRVHDAAASATSAWIALDAPIARALFTSGGVLVVSFGDRRAAIIDGAAVRELEPGCCRTLRATAAAGGVVAEDGSRTRGILIDAAGGVTALADEAALRFAEQTGGPPVPLAAPADRVVRLDGGALLIAGVAGGRAVVRVEAAGATRFRIALDLGVAR